MIDPSFRNQSVIRALIHPARIFAKRVYGKESIFRDFIDSVKGIRKARIMKREQGQTKTCVERISSNERKT